MKERAFSQSKFHQPLTTLRPTQRAISSPKHANFESDTPKWLIVLDGAEMVVAIMSAMLDYAPNVRYVASACKSISQLALAWFTYSLCLCQFNATSMPCINPKALSLLVVTAPSW